MKRATVALVGLLGLGLTLSLPAQQVDINRKVKIPLTIVKESRASIQRGVNFLTDKQMENGSWLNDPSVTALACIALHQSNTTELTDIRKEAVKKGRAFILKHVQKDGAITKKDRRYVNYSTATCLCALAIIDDPADKQVMKNARHFLIDLQLDEDNKTNPTKKDNPFYGGIGYGSGGPKHPDLSNTQWALEALWLTEHLDTEAAGATKEEQKKSELAWKNAIVFLQRVQNVPESSDAQWIVEKDDGGFVYRPDESKVNSKLKKEGMDAPEGLRSYGSMTYAGLKSIIYAKLKKNDYRVKAATEWAKKHYTLDENPVMGPEGHYYYLQTFAKAHAAYGDESVTTPDGKTHQWRVDVLKKLLQLQKSKGEWYNDKHGRWMESIPELVTAYALITMEVALGPELKTK